MQIHYLLELTFYKTDPILGMLAVRKLKGYTLLDFYFIKYKLFLKSVISIAPFLFHSKRSTVRCRYTHTL